MENESNRTAKENDIFDAWKNWAERELPQRRQRADKAYQRAHQINDEVAWQHAEIVEAGYGQLNDMLLAQDPYFSRIAAQMQDVDGETFQVDLRVHRYHRSEVFPLDDSREMLDISHLAPLADLVRNPAQQELALTLRDREFYQWPQSGNTPHIRVVHCNVEDIEIENGCVVRVAPRYGAIFEDRVRRRLERSAQPALDVLADVLDREQNAIISNRNPQLRLLILDGPAGTGKTVVAAHRIAVAASPQSMGIYLTPTNTLRNYIDPVLPRLGLERQRARAWSLAEWAQAVWPEFPWADDLSGMVPDCPWDQKAFGDALDSVQRDHPKASWLEIYREAGQRLGQRPRRMFGVEDVAALLWMGPWAHRKLPGLEPQWIIIDEAQAIPLLVYHALWRWFGGKVSYILAGDLMQQGSQHEFDGWAQIQEALQVKPSQISHLWLRRSYRVPPMIHAASERLRRAINPEANLSESVTWHPHPGKITYKPTQSISQVQEDVKQLITHWRAEGISAIAILAPSADLLHHWVQQLAVTGIELQILQGQESYGGGVVLTTLDIVRGLEFDGVVLLDVNKAAYPETPSGARALYTALTRSRKYVHLIALLDGPDQSPSPWLAQIVS
ncbi:MAG: hypothetical protein C7B46_00130 [Sulfobacillus benefaciens]|uniref:UvrD-like helicase C-terminal domain-containing protein n=1 Tax=Sulfobacillus benefaciens TaxID=453960 RepID=A0A2T2XLS5_9FIRM|nr:MAG: hypothetical protein C7B46_00130 [Sulfobacillus benefaciens]